MKVPYMPGLQYEASALTGAAHWQGLLKPWQF